ncbi:efflux RND transporter periplasmic adaptor subunit [Mailhella sp.]|uniref:efflux RND transporter periplasmic adaptor subunit n=1 Tax=Mailhella sp. TaxID=1981029 RepID=UPI00406378B5
MDRRGRGAARPTRKAWIPWVLTALLAAVAFWLARGQYEREMRDPWTRDGQVTADLLLVTSPVDGVLEQVAVRSGSGAEEGALLFAVRPLHGEDGATVLEKRDADRERKEGRRGAGPERGLVAVRAPSRGWVIESTLQRGGMVKAGEPLFAFAVADSFRVTGFFRETHLRAIREGARARVTLMAWPDRPLDAVVESVGRGIAVSDGALDSRLLPQVTPTFDWVRLARRFPVRVRLVSVPQDMELRVGLTASVQVLEE